MSGLLETPCRDMSRHSEKKAVTQSYGNKVMMVTVGGRDTRQETQDTSHKTQDTKHKTQDTRHKKTRQKTQDTRHKTQDTRHKTQDTKHQTQDTRHKTQDRGWNVGNLICLTRPGETHGRKSLL